jgi:hypothetical protein
VPDGWVLGVGDLLVAENGRLVRMRRLAPSLPGSAIATLAEVVPLYRRASA